MIDQGILELLLFSKLVVRNFVHNSGITFTGRTTKKTTSEFRKIKKLN